MTERPDTSDDSGMNELSQTDAREVLAGLLHDLDELSSYLQQRGRHTYDLAQRFLESARRNDSSRAYDERQATMLEYQHYIWHEIAGLVNQLVVKYGGVTSEDDSPAEQLESGGNEHGNAQN